MAKKRAKKPEPARAKTGRKKWSAGRRNTHKANGSLPESRAASPEPDEKVTIGEAMRRAVEALGDVNIDPGLAPTQMMELGECYEEVARRQAAYDARAEELKTAKKGLDAATELLLEKVRTFTHPAPLPLFDQAEREADHDDMLDAAERGGAEA